MNQIEKDLIGQLRRLRVEAEDSPSLLGPEQLAGFGIAGPAAGVTELLGFGEIGREPPQFAFRFVPVGDVYGGGQMDRRTVLASGNGRDERVDPDRRAVLAPPARHDLVVGPLTFAKLGEAPARRFALFL